MLEIFFQFSGGMPPPGLAGSLGLQPTPGVPSRLDLPPGVSLGQPNPGNVPPGLNSSGNHDKVIEQ